MNTILNFKKPSGVEFWESLPSSAADFAALTVYYKNYWGDRYQIMGVDPNDPNHCSYQFLDTSEEEYANFSDGILTSEVAGADQRHLDYVAINNIEMWADNIYN